MIRFRSILMFLGLMLLVAAQADACPVCFGETESGSEVGLNAAVWLMLGITGAVLSLLSALFLRLRKRIKMSLDGSVDTSGHN